DEEGEAVAHGGKGQAPVRIPRVGANVRLHNPFDERGIEAEPELRLADQKARLTRDRTMRRQDRSEIVAQGPGMLLRPGPVYVDSGRHEEWQRVGEADEGPETAWRPGCQVQRLGQFERGGVDPSGEERGRAVLRSPDRHDTRLDARTAVAEVGAGERRADRSVSGDGEAPLVEVAAGPDSGRG